MISFSYQLLCFETSSLHHLFPMKSGKHSSQWHLYLRLLFNASYFCDSCTRQNFFRWNEKITIKNWGNISLFFILSLCNHCLICPYGVLTGIFIQINKTIMITELYDIDHLWWSCLLNMQRWTTLKSLKSNLAKGLMWAHLMDSFDVMILNQKNSGKEILTTKRKIYHNWHERFLSLCTNSLSAKP